MQRLHIWPRFPPALPRALRSPRSIRQICPAPWRSIMPQSLRLTSCRPTRPLPNSKRCPLQWMLRSSAHLLDAFPVRLRVPTCSCCSSLGLERGCKHALRRPWPVPGASILSCASPYASPPPCCTLRGLLPVLRWGCGLLRRSCKRHNRLRTLLAERAAVAGLSPEVEKPGLLPPRPVEVGCCEAGARAPCGRRPADVFLARPCGL